MRCSLVSPRASRQVPAAGDVASVPGEPPEHPIQGGVAVGGRRRGHGLPDGGRRHLRCSRDAGYDGVASQPPLEHPVDGPPGPESVGGQNADRVVGEDAVLATTVGDDLAICR
jgi:hypothetical protein